MRQFGGVVRPGDARSGQALASSARAKSNDPAGPVVRMTGYVATVNGRAVLPGVRATN
jgi:hypothetical protein